MIPILILIIACGIGVMATPRLVKWFKRYQFDNKERTKNRLESLFIFLPVDNLLTLQVYTAFASAVLFLAMAWTALGQNGAVYLSGVGLVVGFFAPQGAIALIAQKRRRQFADQLVDALTLLSNGLRSGMSLQQSIEMLVNESPKPASQEFSLVLREHRFGVPLEQALNNCAKRTQDEDLALATLAVSTTLQLGGNLAEVFEKIVHTIKDRKILQNKADTLTSQGRMQALVVGAMPYLFLFMTNKVNPELGMLLFRRPIGLVLLAVMILLDIVGYLWVRKICTIRY